MEDIFLVFFEPSSSLPGARNVQVIIAHDGIDDNCYDDAKSVKRDWLQDPTVETRINVGLVLFLDQRGRDGNDGDALIERRALGKKMCGV